MATDWNAFKKILEGFEYPSKDGGFIDAVAALELLAIAVETEVINARDGETDLSTKITEIEQTIINNGNFPPPSLAYALLRTNAAGDNVEWSDVVRNAMIRAYREDFVLANPVANVVDLDVSQYNNFNTLMDQDTTINIINASGLEASAGIPVTHTIQQDGTGGHALAFNGSIKFPEQWRDNIPASIGDPNSTHVFVYVITNNGAVAYGFLAGSDLQ